MGNNGKENGNYYVFAPTALRSFFFFFLMSDLCCCLSLAQPPSSPLAQLLGVLMTQSALVSATVPRTAGHVRSQVRCCRERLMLSCVMDVSLCRDRNLPHSAGVVCHPSELHHIQHHVIRFFAMEISGVSHEAARNSLVLKSPGWGLLVSTIPMPVDSFLCSQYVSGVLNGVYGSQSTAWAQSPFGVQYLIGIDFHLVPSPKPNPSRRAQPGFYHQPIQGYAFWPKTAATLDELE